MTTVLCFGDSNTWGAVPMASREDRRRFGPQERWTGVLQRELGPDWTIIAEGLPGRRTVFDDPVDGAHLSGLRAIRGCLESHRPLDSVLLMLGTNDFKRRFSVEAEEVVSGVDRLLWEIEHLACLEGAVPKVLLVGPAPVAATGIFSQMFAGAERKRAISRPCCAALLNSAASIASTPASISQRARSMASTSTRRPMRPWDGRSPRHFARGRRA